MEMRLQSESLSEVKKTNKAKQYNMVTTTTHSLEASETVEVLVEHYLR